jgi:hypothetical protein
MELFIAPDGTAKVIYGEEIRLEELGVLSIARASVVEPTPAGQWLVDLGPVSGPVLGPFKYRSQGLEAERRWLVAHGLPEPIGIAAPPD